MPQTAALHQPIISEKIRTVLKREAASNGGLKDMARHIGLDYDHLWHQANRGQGILADLIVSLAQHGFREPLRIIAEAAGCDVMPKVQFMRRAHPGKAVRSLAIDAGFATAALAKAIDEALEDKDLNSAERAAIKKAGAEAQELIAELMAKAVGGKP